MREEQLSAEHKALRINLDPTKYGTFAEIGAGQEVARHRLGRHTSTTSSTSSAAVTYSKCETPVALNLSRRRREWWW